MSLFRLRESHGFLIAMIGAALLLRGLVPMGWMPDAGSGFRLEMCLPMADGDIASAAQREAEQLLSEALAGADEPGDDRHKAKDQPCAFSGLSAPWTGAVGVGLASPMVAPSPVLPPFALVAAVGRGLAAPPPPATGPPLLS